MSKRKSIGPVYASYPAREIGLWVGDKIFKVIASIVCTLLWWGAYWVLLGVVNFNKNNFLPGSKETTVNELFKTDISLIVLGITSAFVCIFVFRSRVGDRKRKTKHPQR
jgi:uncharacterized membrane protein YuzA (DUF378 family)